VACVLHKEKASNQRSCPYRSGTEKRTKRLEGRRKGGKNFFLDEEERSGAGRGLSWGGKKKGIAGEERGMLAAPVGSRRLGGEGGGKNAEKGEIGPS